MANEVLLEGDAELIRVLAGERICAIKKKIKKLNAEKEELENMIRTCLVCNGAGKLRVVIPIHEHGRIEKCDTCNGTGKWQK